MGEGGRIDKMQRRQRVGSEIRSGRNSYPLRGDDSLNCLPVDDLSQVPHSLATERLPPPPRVQKRMEAGRILTSYPKY